MKFLLSKKELKKIIKKSKGKKNRRNNKVKITIDTDKEVSELYIKFTDGTGTVSFDKPNTVKTFQPEVKQEIEKKAKPSKPEKKTILPKASVQEYEGEAKGLEEIEIPSTEGRDVKVDDSFAEMNF